MSQVEHWHCACGAHGYATCSEANDATIARHRQEGHTVEIWWRGQRKNGRFLLGVTEDE